MSATLWDEVVTVSLLGTDRRQPPTLGDGPLAEFVAESAVSFAGGVGDDAGGRLVLTVGALTALRRGAAGPLPPRAPVDPPPVDRRPLISPAASNMLRRILADHPILLDEWLAVVVEYQLRVPPEQAIALLLATVRRPCAAAAETAIGPLAGWLRQHWSGLPAPRSTTEHVLPSVLTDELGELLQAPAQRVAATLRRRLDDGAWGHSMRVSLQHFIAALPADGLEAVDQQLTEMLAVGVASPLTAQLADLTAVRRSALADLERSR